MKESMMPMPAQRPENEVQCEALEREIRREIAKGMHVAELAITAWTDVLLDLKLKGENDVAGEAEMEPVMPAAENETQVTYDAAVASGAVLYEIDALMADRQALQTRLVELEQLSVAA